MPMRIDLNADIGESFGHWTLGQDEALLPSLTSANIACGFHAGDPDVMARTVEAAVAHGVGLGAHPSLPDLQGFGRRAMAVTPDETYNLVLYQIGALAAFALRHRQALRHVKPHGALYNMTEQRPDLADAIARAALDFDPGLGVFGLAGGRLVQAAHEIGLPAAHEVFADRGYQPDGTLTPRSDPNALLSDPEEVAARMVRLATEGIVTAADGTDLRLPADTICLHGDGPGAAALARHLRQALEAAGVTVAPVRTP